MENYNKELYHYGVPGMRWGRRKKSMACQNGKSKKL